MKNRLITLAAIAALVSLPAAFAQTSDAPKKPAKGKNGFAAADANGDGFISKDEYMAMPRNQDNPRAAARFKAIDENGDGKISPDEMKAPQAKNKKAGGEKGEGKKAKKVE